MVELAASDLLSRFSGAVFDLDGTLVDSEPAWARAKLIVTARHGRQITEGQLAASAGRSMDEMVAEVFAPDNAKAARAIEEEVFAEAENWLPKLRQPIPGAAAFLRDLHDRGMPVALCSSSPEYLIRDALEQIGVLSAVTLIVSADPLPRRKPDPMPYTVTAERLGLPPAELIAFEDALPGARSAKDAGLFTVTIGPDSTDPEFSFCDMRAPDYATLRSMLGMP